MLRIKLAYLRLAMDQGNISPQVLTPIGTVSFSFHHSSSIAITILHLNAHDLAATLSSFPSAHVLHVGAVPELSTSPLIRILDSKHELSVSLENYSTKHVHSLESTIFSKTDLSLEAKARKKAARC